MRAQRGKRPKGAQSFLTAENQIGAVVFTYFNINNCEADISLVVRGGNSVCFCFFFRKRRGLGWTLCGKLVGRENSNIYKYVQVFFIRWGAMKTKNITLKINSELYDKYREISKKEGWIVSRQFEKCMEAELEKRGRENVK